MELAKLIAPNGIWGKVWLAAHWERKLKKQDYQEIDLRSLLATISAKRSLVSLRATGHLLVGACKIYCKQSAFLEEEADEVRAGLMMAFSRPTEEPEVEISGRIREVRPGALTPILADDQALLGGKKHIARLEDITLKNQGKEDAGSIVASDDLFGALSQTELQEVMRAVRRKVVPKGAFEELESAATGEHHDFDTLPLVALSDQPKVKTLCLWTWSLRSKMRHLLLLLQPKHQHHRCRMHRKRSSIWKTSTKWPGRRQYSSYRCQTWRWQGS